ncbi:MAG: hypothetical protein WD995_00855 [Gemmatimonadota bacterium]
MTVGIRATRFLCLLLVMGACTDIFGTRLERDVRVEVASAGSSTILATIRNEGSDSISYHPYGCYRPLRRVVGGVLEPVRTGPCVSMAVPPVTVSVGERLEVSISVSGAEPGTYRVWLRLSDVGGELDERMSSSDSFELPVPD